MPDKLRMRVAGLILAGGRGRRMGRAKESLPFGGVTLLAWQCKTLLAATDTVLVVARDPQQTLPTISERVVLTYDGTIDQGPLRAMHSGLAHLRDECGFTDEDAAFVTGCDQPFLTTDVVSGLLTQLGPHDALMPRSQDKLQPLTAIYRLRTQTVTEQLLQAGVRTPRSIAEHCDTRIVEEHALRAIDPEGSAGKFMIIMSCKVTNSVAQKLACSLGRSCKVMNSK